MNNSSSLKTLRNTTSTISDWANCTSSNRMNTRDEESMSENGPVDLVKRVKSESRSPDNEEIGEYSSPNTSCYDSLAMSAYFIRKRRRGRCRYTPPYFLPESQNYPSKSSQPGSNSIPVTKDSNNSSNGSMHPNPLLSMNAKSFRGQFTCPNCPMLFSNRDALAMHMMDSVRSQGCPGQAAALISTTTNSTTTTNQYSNLKNVLPTITTSEAVNLLHTSVTNKSSSAVGLTMYSCRVCGENKSSLDSLAMHMLAHAHQEHAKDNDSTNKLNRSLSQIASQISPTEKTGRHPNLPPISPLCFNPIEFSNMQQAFNLAMATMTAAAASANTTSTTNSDHCKDRNLKETPDENPNDSPLRITPPKSHSVPLPLSNSYFGDDNTNITVSGLTPTGSERNESQNSSIKQQTDLYLRNQSFNNKVDDHASKSDDVKDLSMKCEYAMEGESHTAVSNEGDDDVSENLPEVEKEYSEDPDFGTIRQREYFYACRHCRMTFEDRTIFCLHMGLHNVNNPWQCNMCSKVCSGLHEFASHSLHF